MALKALGIALFAVLCLGGCGLTNRLHSTEWTAALDNPPSQDCAKHAIASMAEVSRIEVTGAALDVYLHSPNLTDAEVQEVHARNNTRQFPDFYVAFRKADHPEFRVGFLGLLPSSDRRVIVAHAIITKIGAACGVPDLAARVQEKHPSVYAPYLFNM